MTVYESLRAEIEALSEHVWAVTDEEDDRVCARLLTLARAGVDVAEAGINRHMGIEECNLCRRIGWSPQRLTHASGCALAAYEKVAKETGVLR